MTRLSPGLPLDPLYIPLASLSQGQSLQTLQHKRNVMKCQGVQGRAPGRFLEILPEISPEISQAERSCALAGTRGAEQVRSCHLQPGHMAAYQCFIRLYEGLTKALLRPS